MRPERNITRSVLVRDGCVALGRGETGAFGGTTGGGAGAGAGAGPDGFCASARLGRNPTARMRPAKMRARCIRSRPGEGTAEETVGGGEVEVKTSGVE